MTPVTSPWGVSTPEAEAERPSSHQQRSYSAMTNMATPILRPIVASNIALLSQKLALMELLVSKGGRDKASEQFQTSCKYCGGATIGQHYRHSMDHIELAALVASNANQLALGARKKEGELHYDLRVRGGTLENDFGMSRQRILDVMATFETLRDEAGEELCSLPVQAYFNLSADSSAEIALSSTVGRELGFVLHHAIHHLAMVRIICLNTIGIEECELPSGFGRAPSTLLFDNAQKP